MIGTMAALGIGLAASAGGSVASGVIGSKAAGKAADAQSQAAMYAADLEKQAADNSLAFQKETYADQQRNLAPWLKAGTGAVNTLSSLMSDGGQLTKGWTGEFIAPTAADLYNDPSYTLRRNEGTEAIERSAAARGGLLSGGTGKALNRYAQDYASNEYGNVYNRKLNEYQQNYNEFQNDQANLYNRYAGLAGVGQTAATNLNSAAANTANNSSKILMTSANNIGNAYQNAAYQRASGYVNGANAWADALTGIGKNIGYVATNWPTRKQGA